MEGGSELGPYPLSMPCQYLQPQQHLALKAICSLSPSPRTLPSLFIRVYLGRCSDSEQKPKSRWGCWGKSERERALPSGDNPNFRSPHLEASSAPAGRPPAPTSHRDYDLHTFFQVMVYMTDQENRRSGPTDGVVIDDCQWLPRDVLRCGFLCRECTVLISAVDLSHEHFSQ